MNKFLVIKIKGYPKISAAPTELKSGCKWSLKHCWTVVDTVPAPNTGLWRSDLLFSCLEPVSPRFSHAPNASVETLIGLQKGLKRAPKDLCAAIVLCEQMMTQKTSWWHHTAQLTSATARMTQRRLEWRQLASVTTRSARLRLSRWHQRLSRWCQAVRLPASKSGLLARFEIFNPN